MRFIIMADGKGTRWNNYQDIPKHLIVFNGETLLERTVRLIKEREPQSEIFITSHDERYEVAGAKRYEPLNNVLEIDRFTEELICDDCCFLYGDTFYSEEAMELICKTEVDKLQFFGNERCIVAIRVANGALFRSHVNRVRDLFLQEKINNCKGWQVYQSYSGLPFDKKQMGPYYIFIEDETRDFNSPEDLK